MNTEGLSHDPWQIQFLQTGSLVSCSPHPSPGPEFQAPLLTLTMTPQGAMVLLGFGISLASAGLQVLLENLKRGSSLPHSEEPR